MNSKFKYFILTMLPALLVSGSLLAQAGAADAGVAQSAYSRPSFYGLCFLAIVLLVYIFQLKGVFDAIVANQSEHKKDSSGQPTAMIVIALIGLFQLAPNTASANVFSEFFHNGFGSTAINAVSLIIIFEVLAIIVLTSIIRNLLRKGQPADSPSEDLLSKLFAKFGNDEEGSEEPSFRLPAWWKYGILIIGIWGVAYIGYYQMYIANPTVAEVVEDDGPTIDESNITFLTGDKDIADGKKLYGEKTCNACHGGEGGGGVGPNLTDEYWLHGGDVASIFKSIKYGIPDKGMQAWKDQIAPADMAKIVAYIHSIKGSNPANAKDPQGDLYSPDSEGNGGGAAADTDADAESAGDTAAE